MVVVSVRKCRCGTVLNSYNRSEPPTCGPCARKESLSEREEVLEEARTKEKRHSHTERRQQIL